MWGNHSLLNVLLGIVRVRNPTNLTQIWGLNVRHDKFPNLLNFASLACPEQKVVPAVREYAIAQLHDVTGLEGIALVPPQLEVNRRSLVCH
ncbi:hypothetical protein COP2_010545 [Malus domestica]